MYCKIHQKKTWKKTTEIFKCKSQKKLYKIAHNFSKTKKKSKKIKIYNNVINAIEIFLLTDLQNI